MLQMLVQHLQLDHATDVSAKSTAPLPQPSATSGHGELHELLHVAKSTAGHKQKGNHGNHAPGSSSLLLVYFVAEVTAPHMYYSVSSGLV